MLQRLEVSVLETNASRYLCPWYLISGKEYAL
uniref:Uncharacterized protein n=1 Tax=Rhizophora mucronata TaxID=61149 RepID=A0A2P2PRS0_RHIMU